MAYDNYDNAIKFISSKNVKITNSSLNDFLIKKDLKINYSVLKNFLSILEIKELINNGHNFCDCEIYLFTIIRGLNNILRYFLLYFFWYESLLYVIR